MYISQFSQDGNWYRCRVVEDKFDIPESYCVIQYIDFGNSERKYQKSDLIPLVTIFAIFIGNIIYFNLGGQIKSRSGEIIEIPSMREKVQV